MGSKGGENLFQRMVLPNGLRILVEEIPHVRSVSIGVWVGVGSRRERDDQAGISHFIEHLLFKGTEKRTARQLAEAIEGLGGQINAYTTKEYTCYYAKVMDEHLGIATEVLADMILSPRFDPGDMERERGVILEEIKMYEDTPDEEVHDLFARSRWDGHPLGRPVLGSKEVIAGMRAADILGYFRENYVPGQTVLSVAGHVQAKEVFDLVGGAFDAWEGSRSDLPTGEKPLDLPGVLLKKRRTEQVHLCLGTRGLPTGDERNYSLNVLNTILGGGSSSRLFQKVREEMGLVYSIYSYPSSFDDAGLFTVYAGMSSRYLERVVSLIQREMQALRQGEVSREEMVRAKEQLKGGLMLGLEGTGSRMSHLGRSEILLGRVLSLDELLAKIEAVTLEDLAAIAELVLQIDDLSAAAVGPISEKRLSRLLPGGREKVS
ncbi:MAG: insulinase family protein [Firmicutes bacterium]|nr:insulinase family protein [Bacillota bacterium]MCL5040145.1 insulinase family protein [Bacillota bacterium]